MFATASALRLGSPGSRAVTLTIIDRPGHQEGKVVRGGKGDPGRGARSGGPSASGANAPTIGIRCTRPAGPATWTTFRKRCCWSEPSRRPLFREGSTGWHASKESSDSKAWQRGGCMAKHGASLVLEATPLQPSASRRQGQTQGSWLPRPSSVFVS